MTTILYEPFEICTRTVAAGPIQAAQVNQFFELVYVEAGCGQQQVNDHAYPFGPGDVLLLLPRECNGLEAETEVRLRTVRFLPVFFAQPSVQAQRIDFTQWLRKIEYILFNCPRDGSNLIGSTADRVTVAQLLESATAEYEGERLFCDVLLQTHLMGVLTLVARNLYQAQLPASLAGRPLGQHPAPAQEELFSYLHFHIYEPAKLTTRHLAEHFAVAPSYFGRYFQRLAGVPLKRYLLQYKLKLVESRLQFSDLTLSQIADELGFTDVSHLNKTFLRYSGALPSAFRRRTGLVPGLAATA